MRFSSVLAFRAPRQRSGGVRKCRGCARGRLRRRRAPRRSSSRGCSPGVSGFAGLAAAAARLGRVERARESLRSSRWARGRAACGRAGARRVRNRQPAAALRSFRELRFTEYVRLLDEWADIASYRPGGSVVSRTRWTSHLPVTRFLPRPCRLVPRSPVGKRRATGSGVDGAPHAGAE